MSQAPHRTATAPVADAPEPAAATRRSPRAGIAATSAAALAAGSVASLTLPFLPVGTVEVNFSTAMVLLGWALGWALLVALSALFTDHPQRWAAVPAVFMGISGATVLVVPDAVVDELGWIWPPAVLVLVVWMWGRAGRDLGSRARLWLLDPVLVVLVLLAVAGVYERIAESSAPEVAMPGHLVDVGPYRLHLDCHGTGSPTVILEPGAGGSAASMGLIAPAAARHSRVCVYDRAGRGWSDPAGDPVDGAQVAGDLHTLLTLAHVPGPYVLAGHSFGGLYAMTFAAKFPEDVAGLVLVDSTAAEDKPVRAREPGSYSFSVHASSLFATTSRLGLGHVIAGVNYAELPARYRDDARATFATPKALGGVLEEYVVAGRSTAAAAALHSLGAKPLVVLTATVGTRRGWAQAQDKMAELSTNSVHRFEPGASHVSFVDDPRHAASVVRAIHDVVTSARTGAPIPEH